MKIMGINLVAGRHCEILRFRFILAAFCLSFIATPLQSQDKEKFAVEVEGKVLWQTRNDVRIPNDTGTEFSLVDTVGRGPFGAFRVEAAFDINKKHGFRVVVAPLQIRDTNTLGKDLFFAGEYFDADLATEATYKFSSYRFTYRYRFYNGPTWSWKVGFTGFVRDARIALQQGNIYAEDTDLGFVPLAHLRGEAKMSDRWRFLLDFDGIGAAQGRAFDVATKLSYALSDHLEMAFGYRTIEGGADVSSVYNFAWLHFAVGSIRFRP